MIIIIGRKGGRAERERERLAVEPTLENLIIKDHPYYKPLCLMMIITKPQKKQNGRKSFFLGLLSKITLVSGRVMVRGKMLYFVAFFVHFDKLIRPHPGPLWGGEGPES